MSPGRLERVAVSRAEWREVWSWARLALRAFCAQGRSLRWISRDQARAVHALLESGRMDPLLAAREARAFRARLRHGGPYHHPSAAPAARSTP